jgi:predicted RNA binding protein YcfA (HicA-like mRNA interferase family)
MRHAGPPVRYVTVPLHGTKALKRATLASIIKQAGLTVEQFITLL